MSLKIALLTFNLDERSETFIHHHVRTLPFDVAVLHGKRLNKLRNGDYVGAPDILLAAVRRAKSMLGLPRFFSLHDRWMADWLRKERICVVLAEYGTTAITIQRACGRARVPLIVHFHGYDAYREDATALFKPEYKELFTTGDAFIGVSRHMCEQLARLGAPTEKIHYIPYFVDPNVFCDAAPGSQPPRFLAVGRFVEKKSPTTLINALAIVVRNCPEVSLDFIGDGPLLPGCRGLVTRLGLDEHVNFHGPRDHAFVAERMRSARAFVQHSITARDGDSEGTPVAILEAQSCGLPVVATRHAGIVDVVVENETGFLVDEHDVEAMAGAMLKLARAPSLAQQMGVAGRRRIREHFSYEQTMGRLTELLVRAGSSRIGSK